MTIAMIISLAAFSLIEIVMRAPARSAPASRPPSAPAARWTTITRELRSQVCVLRSDPSLMTSARSLYVGDRRPR